jgi:hypothetical protein
MEHNQAVTDMAAEKYVLGELGNGEREQFEEHYFNCPDCAQDVRDLASLAEGARVLLNTQPMNSHPTLEPAQRRASRWPDAWRLPWLRLHPVAGLAWAGALLLVTMFAGYQTMQVRKLSRAQILTSFLLLPDTRGEATPISTARIGQFFLLEADLPGASGNLQWDLRRADSNRVMANDEAPAPAAGTSFKVLVPSSVLAPAEYTLTVRPATDPAKKTWLFRFRIGQTLR